MSSFKYTTGSINTNNKKPIKYSKPYRNDNIQAQILEDEPVDQPPPPQSIPSTTLQSTTLQSTTQNAQKTQKTSTLPSFSYTKMGAEVVGKYDFTLPVGINLPGASEPSYTKTVSTIATASALSNAAAADALKQAAKTPMQTLKERVDRFIATYNDNKNSQNKYIGWGRGWGGWGNFGGYNTIADYNRTKYDDLISINLSKYKSVHCNDDGTRNELDTINYNINAAVSRIETDVKNSSVIDEIIAAYKEGHNVYAVKINALDKQYDDLGTDQEVTAQVDAYFKPSIDYLNEIKTDRVDKNKVEQDKIDKLTSVVGLGALLSRHGQIGAMSARDTSDDLTIDNTNMMSKYYNTIEVQNAQLDNVSNNAMSMAEKNDRLTDNNKVITSTFTFIKYYLFIFYYALVAYILIKSFFIQTRPEFIIQLVIVFTLVIFPFVIYVFESFLYNSGNYFYSIFKGVAYEKYDYNEASKNATNENTVDMDDMRKPRNIIPPDTYEDMKKKGMYFLSLFM